MDKDVELRSFSGQFSEFLESTIWADMRAELGIWLEGVRDGLEDPEATERDLFRNQGRAEAIRYVLSLPETIRDTLVDIEQQKRKEQEDESNG
jgi:hypothetical protein